MAKAVKKAAAKKPAPRKTAKKVIALFPEAAFGPALNSVGIGQALEKLGHKVVFLSDPGFLDVYKGYGFEAHPVNLSEPMPPEEMAKFWVDFINGHIPNFRKTPLRADRQLCEGLLEHDRRDREMGGEGPARRSRQGQARCRLRRQCHPVSGDQALREEEQEAVGPHHLVLGKRDRGSGYSAASVGLRREGQEGACNLSQALQPGDQADPRQVQRIPEVGGREEVSARAVLRGEPAHEPAALSVGGEIQAPSQAAGPRSSSISKAACARTSPIRCRASRRTTTSRCSM